MRSAAISKGLLSAVSLACVCTAALTCSDCVLDIVDNLSALFDELLVVQPTLPAAC